MTDTGHQVEVLYGKEMSAEQRDKTLADFRDGKFKVLISTNVLARGIDILQVSLVVNYDLPMFHNNEVDPETYLIMIFIILFYIIFFPFLLLVFIGLRK